MWSIQQKDDYDNILGQGVAAWMGIEKSVYNSKDFGIIQLMSGGAAD
jgi:hypothetical protein